MSGRISGWVYRVTGSRRLSRWRYPTCEQAHTPCRWPRCFDWEETPETHEMIRELLARGGADQ